MQIHIIGRSRLGLSLGIILTQRSITHNPYDRSFPSRLNGLRVYLRSKSLSLMSQRTSEYHSDVCVLHAVVLSANVPVQEANVGCLHPIQSFPV